MYTNALQIFNIQKSMKRQRILLILIIVGVLLWVFFRRSTKEQEYYTVVRDPGWEQIYLLDREANFLAFSDELISAIASEEGIVIATRKENYQNFFSGLDQNSFDGVLTPLLPPPNRYNVYAISNPYFLLGPVLVVKEDSTVTSLQEMQGKTLAVMRGGSLVFDINGPKDINYLPFDNITEALDSVLRDATDGMILDILPAYFNTKSYYAGLLKIATPPLTRRGVRLIAKNDQRGNQLISEFNKGLEKVINNGKYRELVDSWGFQNALNISIIPSNNAPSK